MYRLNEALTEEMAKLRLECDAAKNVAEKTKGFYDKLRKERD